MEVHPSDFIPCSVKVLPPDKLVEAAARAVDHNPANRPPFVKLMQVLEFFAGKIKEEKKPVLTANHLALVTTKYWGATGVKLTVGFPFDTTPADVQARILQHMNAWGAYCKASFVLTTTDPQVRIARAADGYWSYLGTDILSIPRNEPTMNLQGFTMNTPESEYHRVVRHETGHTLGFPHEHMRAELVARIDKAKAIAYFAAADGWSAQMVQEQVLTPLSAASIRGTPNADQDSIMCYQLPGSITKDGQPIRGGVDIDPDDQAFSGKLYPLGIDPPVPPPPPPPPPPPGPSPTRLFQVTINRAIPKSGTLTLRSLPVPVPVGKYDFSPSGVAPHAEHAGHASEVYEGEASL